MNDLSVLKHDAGGTGKRRRKNNPYVRLEDALTTSSYLGLVVTINTALKLHFFGHIRGACGSNNHPDPPMFINVYRLLMTNSLIKPPRGSNVTGSKMLQALLDLKDLEGEKNKESMEELLSKVDAYLDCDVEVGNLEEMDHQDSLTASIDPYALTVFGGHISRKMRKIQPAKGCLTCSLDLCSADSVPLEERETLLQMRSRGGLLRPSSKLLQFVIEEESVIRVASKCSLHVAFLFTILDDLLDTKKSSVELIGCEEHQRGLTTAVITHYLNCRMHFVCAEADRAVLESHRSKRDMAKRARLN
ncbi:Transposable element P transposase [Frankliniella fusca]|uniref:Transposable element P transposase n=1 Tax=Frankliniella fusca TaxID=407009 RepID=A0AAE1HIP8_9NEOP|nr:Transposable element P transposase [Frankliniella fusca]